VSRAANALKALKSTAQGRLYACDALLEGPVQDFQDVAANLGPSIEKERPLMRQQYFSRQ
jgi:hypothetical protein